MTSLSGRCLWKNLSEISSEWKAKAQVNSEMLWGRGVAWDEISSAWTGELAGVQKESEPEFGHVLSLLGEMPFIL